MFHLRTILAGQRDIYSTVVNIWIGMRLGQCWIQLDVSYTRIYWSVNFDLNLKNVIFNDWIQNDTIGNEKGY